ncbi:MAG TPA: arylesterase [Verrucomicrobiales bacterium]|nr:arylesterase [Verrucomicrobiales bacterium]
MACTTTAISIFLMAFSVLQSNGNAFDDIQATVPHSEKFGAPSHKTITVLGDSLAAGYGLARNEAFPALLQKKIEQESLPFRVYNGGVSGDTTAGGLRRVQWILRKKVDILIIELGGNDGLRGIDTNQTRSNLEGIILKARKKNPKIRIVLCGMKMPPNLGKEFTDQFEALYPKIARKHKVAHVPFLLEGLQGKPELFQQDQIHPTPAGQIIITRNVWKVLKPILREILKED